MILHDSIRALHNELAHIRSQGKRIALVPTMGALHDGHLSLIKLAKAQADYTVVTIFVNPTQFDQQSDLDAYPNTHKRDQDLLEMVKTDLLFRPVLSEIYPENFQTSVQVLKLSQGLCGINRHNHFTAVATIVTKLLLITLPNYAIFGEKDYQQLCVIKRLVDDLNIPVQILAAPTLRDPDGLALSSRNHYLSPTERTIAPALFHGLYPAKIRFCISMTLPMPLAPPKLKFLAQGFQSVDYLELVDAHSLKINPDPKIRSLPFAGAAWLGKARLIDNICHMIFDACSFGVRI